MLTNLAIDIEIIIQSKTNAELFLAVDHSEYIVNGAHDFSPVLVYLYRPSSVHVHYTYLFIQFSPELALL